jgi:thiamine-monophosphate kinase
VIAEDALIARYLAPIAGTGALGLKDDVALVVPPQGKDLVLTKDALVSGVHFFANDPPASIARKALRVNLSDLAAKGATPAGFLMALALPAGLDESWIAAFAAALGEDARSHACPLLGGDTVRAAGGLSISITALGWCDAGRMVRRTSGRAGQRLLVSGTIGDAALGLRLRLEPDAPWARALPVSLRAHLADRYLHPRPRNALALALAAHAAAAMDVSDGLLGDAVKLAAASGIAGLHPRIMLDNVPLSPAARAALDSAPDLLQTIMAGGDDYEVLMTAEADRVPALLAACSAAGCDATEIGELVMAEAPAFLRADGAAVPFSSLSFQHDWPA